jgi:hypothetical protein
MPEANSFTLQASRRFSLFCSVLFALAVVVAVVFLGDRHLLWLVLQLSLIAVLAMLLKRQLCAQGRIEALVYRAGDWQLLEAGQAHSVEFLGAVVWPGLVFLRFQGQGYPRQLVLLADSCGADAFRRLRVLLRQQLGA